ncbi:FtsH protease activity modulator HflK [Desulfovibrio sp. OttesenSCG-928-F07]|nr:FtsH protease activity modulator HflK [Desulfovibrio sp. OttesenSCG-928-F07]
MNWDWDKLQEKRQRQSGTPPKNERPDEGDPFGGGDGGDNGGRGPGGPGGPGFGQMGNAFKQIKQVRFPVIPAFIALCIFGWLASGIFIVGPEERGVITRFGAYSRTVEPGPHYHLPFPIEASITPKVHHVQRVEIGFRTLRANNGQSTVRSVLEEAAMLTGDENIVNVGFIVQYQISDPVAFLFNADLQIPNFSGSDIYSEAVKNAAEAAMREVIGGSLIDAALTDGKNEIQIKARDLLQEIMNMYNAGLRIQAVQLQDVHPPQEVSAAFKDVASAREDRSRAVNEAEAYRNEILPRTSGQAAEIVFKAEAYKQAVVEKATGDAQRFLSVLTEYNKAKDVTKKRMYIETMEEILSSPDVEKIIIGKDAGNGVLPFLPLEKSLKAGGK